MKHLEEPADDMSDVDDNSTRFHVGTTVFKVFGNVEHQGQVTGYDPANKLCHHIFYDDDDSEEYYHNEVKNQRKISLSKRRQWRNPSPPRFITYIQNMLLKNLIMRTM